MVIDIHIYIIHIYIDIYFIELMEPIKQEGYFKGDMDKPYVVQKRVDEKTNLLEQRKWKKKNLTHSFSHYKMIVDRKGEIGYKAQVGEEVDK